MTLKDKYNYQKHNYLYSWYVGNIHGILIRKMQNNYHNIKGAFFLLPPDQYQGIEDHLTSFDDIFVHISWGFNSYHSTKGVFFQPPPDQCQGRVFDDIVC